MPAATPNLALPYPVPADTADVPRDIQALAVKLDVSGAAVTALPAAPTDGQECFFIADAANGIVWHLRYRAASASAFKWEYVGGQSLYAAVEAAGTLAVANAFADLAGSPGPSITLPLAGDYTRDYTANIGTTGAAAGQLYGMGAINQRTGANRFAQFSAIGAGSALNMTAFALGVNEQVGDVVKIQYYSQVSVTSVFSFRRLRILPVRVG